MKSSGSLPFHLNCCMKGINYFYISSLKKRNGAAYFSIDMPEFHSFLFCFFISMTLLISWKQYLKITQVAFNMQLSMFKALW